VNDSKGTASLAKKFSFLASSILVSHQGFGEHKTEQPGGHSQEQQCHRQAPINELIICRQQNELEIRSNPLRHCLYRQDLFAIPHYHKRADFPTCARCSENHNNTCAENLKIRGLKFDTL